MATAGALSRAAACMITRRATIIATKKLTDELVAVTLEATGFRGVTCTPGEKVQTAMNSVFGPIGMVKRESRLRPKIG